MAKMTYAQVDAIIEFREDVVDIVASVLNGEFNADVSDLSNDRRIAERIYNSLIAGKALALPEDPESLLEQVLGVSR